MLERLWLTVLPVFWRVALLPAAIEWTPPRGCGTLGCVAVDAALNLALLAPFAAIARWEGAGLAGLGLATGVAVRGLAVGVVAAAVAAGVWVTALAPVPPTGLGAGPWQAEPVPAVAARLAFAAVLEECAYRGFVQRRLAAEFGQLLGVPAAAALFALGHGAALAMVYQTEGTSVLGALGYLFVAGCVLGALFAAGGSVWASALPHATFNILRAATSAG
jgi:membrane protease YdiL (CAAX protease family)